MEGKIMQVTRTMLVGLMIAGVVTTGCRPDPETSENKVKPAVNERVDDSVLQFNRQLGTYTDPGKYKHLYKGLPDSLPEVCQVVRSQTIHPFAELPRFRDQGPTERWIESLRNPWHESLKYPTVESILGGLQSFDPAGLVPNRKPENRLVLGCRENSILLASILKSRGIPARVRYGFAPYLMPGLHSSHVICEVWNEGEKRWMLVDPTTNMVDFSRDKFDFSNEVWQKMRQNKIDAKLYGPGGEHNGLPSIIQLLCHDLASVLGTEYPITQYSPIIDQALKGEGEFTLSADQMRMLDEISELMSTVDTGGISKLQVIYRDTPEIQITKFHVIKPLDPTAANSEVKVRKNDDLNKKPIIEFVDIPGGTFMMGSPSTEKGREDDEIQHRVTLSAFKMSKYPVTFAQYALFCGATGRQNPFRFRRENRENLPVSNVNWHDAKAFADWMNCRLPTEAEWEYATRANSTTPFYTGESLTHAQANFDGKGAVPVGGFPPNAFGLFDMHGNIWEWCNDWYGAYGTSDVSNPQGSDTGERKIVRGGGWRDPASKCRSAFRNGGEVPGARGTGIGFRLVKSE